MRRNGNNQTSGGGIGFLAIQDKDKNNNRHWIVVAFMGDIPQVFTPDKVRKPKPAPVVKEVVMYTGEPCGPWGIRQTTV